jgi:transcriptional antiterminator RfaH
MGVVKMIQWYAFQSKPRKEQLLYEQLRIRQIETYFPRIHVRPINPRARKVKPYFPGYVFGHVDLQETGRSVLDWIPGAIGIVSFGDEPAFVPDNLIKILQQHLETINAFDRRISETFLVGGMVTIHGGPFAGYEAIFNAFLPGRDRVEVLLKILQGSQLRVELPVEQITLRKPSSFLTAS